MLIIPSMTSLPQPSRTKFVVAKGDQELKGSTPTGLGQVVHPIFRFLAGTIGFVGILTLGLSVFLSYVGKTPLQMDVKTIIDLALSTILGVYGVSIAIRGKAPSGILPWK